MRLIKQVGEDGCGIACLAMITGASYATIYEKYPLWQPHGTTKREMLNALRKLGVSANDSKPIRSRSYQDFEFHAVLHGYCEGTFHWVVWDAKRQLVLDPYRDDDGREYPFRCTSYIGLDRVHGRLPR